ncbi:MAG: hypothetical protein MK080_09870 [Opitutales bacterium]|nr:hypothetical protein [Opitutales bacterium]
MSEKQSSDSSDGFNLPMKWVVIAVLLFMLIYNTLLFLDARGKDSGDSQETMIEP